MRALVERLTAARQALLLCMVDHHGRRAELGLERVVKLASNEGAFGPLPAAVAAFEAAAGELNRYPDGGGVSTYIRRAFGGRP